MKAIKSSYDQSGDKHSWIRTRGENFLKNSLNSKKKDFTDRNLQKKNFNFKAMQIKKTKTTKLYKNNTSVDKKIWSIKS